MPKLVKFVKLFILANLILSGIEKNPGPTGMSEILCYTNFIDTIKNFSGNYKYTHINFQNLSIKFDTFRQLVVDLGCNNILGISETWLTSTHLNKNWEVDNARPRIFRNDRDYKNIHKSKGGGVLLLIPKHLSPARRDDLVQKDKRFEGLWIEIRNPNKRSNFNKQLIDISYCPHKSLTKDFIAKLENELIGDCSENKDIIMGDYNINALDKTEQTKLLDLVDTFGLSQVNNTIPTRVTSTG